MRELKKYKSMLKNVEVNTVNTDDKQSIIQISPVLQIIFFGNNQKDLHNILEFEDCPNCLFEKGEMIRKRTTWKNAQFDQIVIPVRNKNNQLVFAFSIFIEVSKFEKNYISPSK